jgi:hypothetical protein
MSVGPSVCIEHLVSHWSDFFEISYLSIFLKSVDKFKFNYYLSTITGTSYEDQYTYLIISRSALLRERNVSDKRFKENQNAHLVTTFVSKIVSFIIT